MAIASPGIGSNIDVNGIVAKLVELERQPIQQLNLREASFQAKISALGSLKGTLSSLQNAAFSLSTVSRFRGMTATVANKELLTASATSEASTGSYDIEVKALAQAQRLASGTFASTDAVVGTGTLTFRFGTTTAGNPGSFAVNTDTPIQTVTIDGSNNTLAGVRDAINQANIGATASIINDGTGYRLVISAKESGAAHSLQIQVDEGTAIPADNTDTTGLSQLAHDPTAAIGSGQNLSEKVTAQDALVAINGLDVSSSKNTISTAIDGVTLSLVKASVGTTTTLTIGKDSAGIRSAIDGFVKAYNDATRTLRDLTAFNADTKTGGALLGDTSVLTLQRQLRSALNSALPSLNGFQTLSEVGIAVQRDGTLTVDGTKLQAAIDNPDKDIAQLFAAAGTPSDSTFSYVSSTAGSKAGRYEVVVTQAAAQGFAVGTSAAASLTIDSSNDQLTLAINGSAATIQLTHKSYASLADLITEIQQRINGATAFTNAGVSATVTETAGIISITSSTYGDDSKLEVTGGDALANLFGTVTSTAGLDVQGSIGGRAATGVGQLLTADFGDAQGLTIETTDSTLGSLGFLEFTLGFGSQFSSTLTSLLGTGGPLNARIDGINASIKQLSDRRDQYEKRALESQQRFLAQYNALDATISAMLSTSQFLQQQLAALPQASST